MLNNLLINCQAQPQLNSTQLQLQLNLNSTQPLLKLLSLALLSSSLFLTFTMVNVLGTMVTILGTVVTILGTVVTIQGMVGDQPTVSGRPSWGRCATIIWILVDHRGDTR